MDLDGEPLRAARRETGCDASRSFLARQIRPPVFRDDVLRANVKIFLCVGLVMDVPGARDWKNERLIVNHSSILNNHLHIWWFSGATMDLEGFIDS